MTEIKMSSDLTPGLLPKRSTERVELSQDVDQRAINEPDLDRP